MDGLLGSVWRPKPLLVNMTEENRIGDKRGFECFSLERLSTDDVP